MLTRGKHMKYTDADTSSKFVLIHE